MRKLLLVLTLLVCSIGFISAAAPATASAAANCTATQSFTYWNSPYLKFNSYLGPCTDVDTAEMKRFLNGGQYSGWFDVTTGAYIYAPSASNPEIVSFGRPGGDLQSAGWAWNHLSWCGGAAHVVNTNFVWRIHNRVTNTWGSWHWTVTSNYAINC